MTVVIGMKTATGTILAADCQGTSGSNKRLLNKISVGLFGEDEEGFSGNLTGAYFGTAGYFFMVDVCAALFPGFLSKEANRADLLTSEEVLNTTREGFLGKIDSLEERMKKRFELRLTDEERNSLYEERDRLSVLLEARCFMEDTIPGPVFSTNRIVTRLSDNFDPDLVLVSNGKVEKTQTWCCIGSGQKYSSPVLEKHYVSGLSSNEGLVLISEAINASLANKDDFKGYSLVLINKSSGKFDIKTAYDPVRDRLDLSQLVWAEDYRFHYRGRNWIEQSPLNFTAN